jgi:hypothetical protein
MPRRRGSALVELLTALPLLAIATGCSLLLLVQAAADRRAHHAAQAGARELRHARAVLAADLAPLRARDLLTVSDTLLGLRSQLGLTMVCAQDALSIDVAPAAGSTAAWLDALRAGDEVLAFEAANGVGDPPRPVTASLAAPARRLGAGRCGALVVRQRWQLALRGALPPGLTLTRGAPLLVQREVQYVHYRSNGQWWLGRRTRDGATWETLQPLAGPLASPAQGGLTLRGRSATGTPTQVTDSMAALALTLRVPPTRRVTLGAPSRLVLPADSLVSELPLRGDAWSRGAG